MFTGIIKEIGRVTKIARQARSVRLGVKAPLLSADAVLSDSIAINGVCLTVVAKEKDTLYFEAVKPTLDKTNLKFLKIGHKVNLETALKASDKLGGHFVLGHIEALSRLKKVTNFGDYHRLELDLPPGCGKFMVDNGSVAIDGISLTVKKVVARSFSLDIIPFTWKGTTLSLRRPGYMFNLECDYLLKGKMPSR